MYQTDAQPALPATAGASRYSLQVVDSLVSIGIVRDLVTGRAQQPTSPSLIIIESYSALLWQNSPDHMSNSVTGNPRHNASFSSDPDSHEPDMVKCLVRTWDSVTCTSGDTTSSAPEEWVAKTERGPPKLVAAVGADKFGAVAVLRSSLVPELVTEVPLPGDILPHSVLKIIVTSLYK